MPWELYFTSAPRGLRPGSSDYCVVAATEGLSEALQEKLQSLCIYKAVFPPNDPRFPHNPIAFAHHKIAHLSVGYHILARSCAAPADHTHRSNQFAHLLALKPEELPAGGPAWLLSQAGLWRTAWHGEPRWLPPMRSLPRGEVSPAPCRAWEQATGDAGWAGTFLEALERTPPQPAYLIYSLDQQPLTLLAEACALLPRERRWDVTFSTYFTSAARGSFANWRCVPDQTPEAAELRRGHTMFLVDATHPLPRPPASAYAEMARAGRTLIQPARPAPAAEVPGASRKSGVMFLPSNGPAPAASERPAKAAATSTAPIARFEPPPRLREERRSIGFGWGFLAGLLLGLMSMAGVGLALWFIPSSQSFLVANSQAMQKAQRSVDKKLARAEMEKKRAVEELKTINKAMRRFIGRDLPGGCFVYHRLLEEHLFQQTTKEYTTEEYERAFQRLLKDEIEANRLLKEEKEANKGPGLLEKERGQITTVINKWEAKDTLAQNKRESFDEDDGTIQKHLEDARRILAGISSARYEESSHEAERYKNSFDSLEKQWNTIRQRLIGGNGKK